MGVHQRQRAGKVRHAHHADDGSKNFLLVDAHGRGDAIEQAAAQEEPLLATGNTVAAAIHHKIGTGSGSDAVVDMSDDVSDLTKQHPLLQIELLLDDRRQDMVREAIDVGIRVGNLPDLAGTAKLIGTMHRVIVASPAYLDDFGTPTHPHDFSSHRIVGGPAGAQISSWQFERGGQAVSVDPQPNISTNDTAGALAAAVGGLGITSTTSWACRDELNSGALVQLLPEWQMADLPVHAYFPMGRSTRLAARLFVEYIVAELA